MPGRKYSQANSGYRYGFNGKENDNDEKGEGNQQDYGFRIYDPRLGRFLSVDPLIKSYPWYTPYQFAGNMPIAAVDVDGGEPRLVTGPIMYGHSAPKLKAFAKGVVKAVLYGVGFFTEIIGREEYGSRIKNPNPARDFPIIQDKSYKELAAEMLVAPAQLVLDIKKDPTNPELWGQAALMIGILKFDFGIKGRAPDIALGLNEPVKAGPPRSLIRFSEEQNAYMHYDWNKPFGSLAKQSPTDVSFGDLFDRVIEHVAQNKGTIKFDITNLDFGRVKADLGQNALNSASLTNYEFNTIMNNKSYLKSTKFYENGKLQNTKEVVDRYQKAHPTTSSSN